MKRSFLRLAAMAGLTCGLGFGMFASATDPDCTSACQEILRDCLAQSVGSTTHCFRAYRECAMSCVQP